MTKKALVLSGVISALVTVFFYYALDVNSDAAA